MSLHQNSLRHSACGQLVGGNAKPSASFIQNTEARNDAASGSAGAEIPPESTPALFVAYSWGNKCQPQKRPSRLKPALVLILACVLTVYAASVIDKALARAAIVAANHNPCFLEGC